MTWFAATETSPSGVGGLTTPEVVHLGYTAPPRNDNCSTSGERDALEIVLAVLTVPLTILTVVGNFLLIFTILTTEPLRTVTNSYVVSIAFRSVRNTYKTTVKLLCSYTRVHGVIHTRVHCHTHVCILSYTRVHVVLHTRARCHTHVCTLSCTRVHFITHTCVHCHIHACTLSYTRVYIVIHTRVCCHTHACTLSYTRVSVVIYTCVRCHQRYKA